VKVYETGTVHYYVRGKICLPDFLLGPFAKTPEKADVLKTFDVIPFCPRCPEEELHFLKQDCTKIGQKKNTLGGPKITSSFLVRAKIDVNTVPFSRKF